MGTVILDGMTFYAGDDNKQLNSSKVTNLYESEHILISLLCR